MEHAYISHDAEISVFRGINLGGQSNEGNVGCRVVTIDTVLMRDLFVCSGSGFEDPWEVRMEKAMATHSSTLAWKIPWMEEPGRLQSMGSLRVGHHWATSLSLFTFMHWRRKWQLTPVFLPGESQGRGSLVGYHLWGRTELNMTEVT